MSGHRKRTGGGTILDQLEPRSARAKGDGWAGIDVEPRWLLAGAGAVAVLVAVLAVIAWDNGPRVVPPARAATLADSPSTATAETDLPRFEDGPARIQRAEPSDATAAAALLAHTEPPPEPLVVLPREVEVPTATNAEEDPPAVRTLSTARTAKSRPQALSPKRAAARQPAPKRPREKPATVQAQADEPDSDVALITAIRKATEDGGNGTN